MHSDSLRERARAKINLSLEVLGKRKDGYHELRSLVVFSDTADFLTASNAGKHSLSLGGPYGRNITGGNLIDTAYDHMQRIISDAPSLSIHLEKNLPIASGIGGGSADAAAALRLLCRFSGLDFKELDLRELAHKLGADVPVCLMQQPVLMSGIGETLTSVSMPFSIHAVLINPGVGVSTGEVFKRLNASPCDGAGSQETELSFTHAEDIISYMIEHPNHMEPVAVNLEPRIGQVLQALSETPNNLITRMSGSGATCFALYAEETDAASAAEALTKQHPHWWVRKSVFNSMSSD